MRKLAEAVIGKACGLSTASSRIGFVAGLLRDKRLWLVEPDEFSRDLGGWSRAWQFGTPDSRSWGAAVIMPQEFEANGRPVVGCVAPHSNCAALESLERDSDSDASNRRWVRAEALH